jgi:hypothetical protein
MTHRSKNRTIVPNIIYSHLSPRLKRVMRGVRLWVCLFDEWISGLRINHLAQNSCPFRDCDARQPVFVTH